MKRKRAWAGVLAASVCLCQSQASANNLGFLKNTPSELLTDDDRELQRAAMMTVLDDENATTQRTWKNPHSGHSGSIKSLGNYQSEDGLHCRKLKIANLTDGLKNEGTYPFCKTVAGEWIVASGKKLAKAT